MRPKRTVTVYHGATCYCLVAEWGIGGVVETRWHNDLTLFSIRRIAHLVGKYSLQTRPLYGGRIGYVAEMPGCIIGRKETPK